MTAPTKPARRRVPAAERREELIAAAVHEFAHGGLHGTPVERIARRVGVAQPYVFSLFPSKRDLFLAALERGLSALPTRSAQPPPRTPRGARPTAATTRSTRWAAPTRRCSSPIATT